MKLPRQTYTSARPDVAHISSDTYGLSKGGYELFLYFCRYLLHKHKNPYKEATLYCMLRVAITGPESTGKSTLSQALATYFDAPLVAEYARHYLETLGRSYIFEDLHHIAQSQVAEEEQLIAKETADWLFADTELLVMKIWSENAYQQCDAWILEQIPLRIYDFYLLTKPDIPWTPDPLREHPELREYFFDLYEKELQSRGFAYGIVAGSSPQERLQCALLHLQKAFPEQTKGISFYPKKP
jgi:NadR type nicotinamide-nucleotide adenylyltransferase